MRLLNPRVAQYLKSRRRYPLASRYDIKNRKIVNLASNENPYGPSPLVKRVLKKELDKINTYPDPLCREVKDKISSYLGVKPENICVGNGSDELIDLICKAFIDKNERVLIPLPTFALYEITTKIAGGIPTYCKLPNFQWEKKILLAKSRKTRIAFIGRPNNPTGTCASVETILRLAKIQELVVIDEAYGEFAGFSLAQLAAQSRNIVVLKTFSKAFGLAGLRIGYAVGPRKIIDVLEQIRAPFNINRFAQKAAVAALTDLEYVQKTVKKIQIQREWLCSKIRELGLQVLPSLANFVMVGLRPWGVDATTLCNELAKENIFVRDLSGFKGAGKSYVRITVGTPNQNLKLVRALRKVGRKYGAN